MRKSVQTKYKVQNMLNKSIILEFNTVPGNGTLKLQHYSYHNSHTMNQKQSTDYILKAFWNRSKARV